MISKADWLQQLVSIAHNDCWAARTALESGDVRPKLIANAVRLVPTQIICDEHVGAGRCTVSVEPTGEEDLVHYGAHALNGHEDRLLIWHVETLQHHSNTKIVISSSDSR